MDEARSRVTRQSIPINSPTATDDPRHNAISSAVADPVNPTVASQTVTLGNGSPPERQGSDRDCSQRLVRRRLPSQFQVASLTPSTASIYQAPPPQAPPPRSSPLQRPPPRPPMPVA